MVVTNNPAKNRYELVVDGYMSVVDYRLDDEVLTINRVYVPDELRGQGVAAKLMEAVVADCQKRSLHIEPVCSYAATYLTRHRL